MGSIFLLLAATFVVMRGCSAAPAVSINCELQSTGQWCCKCNTGGIGMNVKNLQGFMLMCNAKKELGFIKTFVPPVPAKSVVQKPEVKKHLLHPYPKSSAGNKIIQKTIVPKVFRPEMDKNNPGVRVVKVYKKEHHQKHTGIKKVIVEGKTFYGKFTPDGKFKILPNYNPNSHKRRKYKLEFSPKDDVIARHMKDRDCFQHDIHLKNGQTARILGYIWVCRHGVLVRTNHRVMKYI